MAAYTTIDDPTAYFQTELYTGDSGTSHARTFDSDTNMQPDLVWIKGRDIAESSRVYDSVRGADKHLSTNATAAEASDFDLTSFDSDGFTINSADQSVNSSSYTYAAWCWKESATAGFDIVSFTGNATDDRDISHSLSAVPHFWVTRNRADTESWVVYHHKNTSAPETDFLLLDATQATTDNAVVWSDEAPTSSVYTVGNDNSTNGNTDAMITYLWRSVQGYSKIGSYTGNGNADGTFVYTGFLPAFILVKSVGDNDWVLFDNKRPGYNGSSERYRVNQSAVVLSSTGEYSVDHVSNGFKFRGSGGGTNESGTTFIYMAFAEAPFVNSEGVPCNAR